MAMTCVPLAMETTDATLREMERLAAEGLADLFEVRVDGMAECDLARLLERRPRPIIITNRLQAEGGMRQQDETARLDVLARAVELGVDYVDVELAALDAFEERVPASKRGPTKLIVSSHDFDRMPADFAARAKAIEATSADVVKVVGMAKRLEDNLPVFEAMRGAKKPTIALAMGELGEISRVLAGKFGGWLTFASRAAGGESAPGQVTAEAMQHLYRAGRVTPATKVYAVMGNPVEHSLSPAIHNAAFAAEGIDAVYVRLKVEGDPAAAVRMLEAIPVDGYSVTIPHKEAVMGACVAIGSLARKMRAVNTLVRRDDGYHATNTDVTSAMRALAEAVGTDDFTGKRAVVVGSGGVGRAYAHGLVSRGAKVWVTDIDVQRAQSLAFEAGVEASDGSKIAEIAPDILMNGTPLGMWPKVDVTPVDRSALRAGMVVFDAVYNPRETRLLREAAEAGCATVSGVEQFVGQAVEQFELWTGRRAPVDLMRGVVLSALEQKH